jgi:hypothetical protein
MSPILVAVSPNDDFNWLSRNTISALKAIEYLSSSSHFTLPLCDRACIRLTATHHVSSTSPPPPLSASPSLMVRPHSVLSQWPLRLLHSHRLLLHASHFSNSLSPMAHFTRDSSQSNSSFNSVQSDVYLTFFNSILLLMFLMGMDNAT